MKNNKGFLTEMSKYRSLKGFTSNASRMVYDEKDEEIPKVSYLVIWVSTVCSQLGCKVLQ